jgi:hypothetical protein
MIRRHFLLIAILIGLSGSMLYAQHHPPTCLDCGGGTSHPCYNEWCDGFCCYCNGGQASGWFGCEWASCFVYFTGGTCLGATLTPPWTPVTLAKSELSKGCPKSYVPLPEVH